MSIVAIGVSCSILSCSAVHRPRAKNYDSLSELMLLEAKGDQLQTTATDKGILASITLPEQRGSLVSHYSRACFLNRPDRIVTLAPTKFRNEETRNLSSLCYVPTEYALSEVSLNDGTATPIVTLGEYSDIAVNVNNDKLAVFHSNDQGFFAILVYRISDMLLLSNYVVECNLPRLSREKVNVSLCWFLGDNRVLAAYSTGKAWLVDMDSGRSSETTVLSGWWDLQLSPVGDRYAASYASIRMGQRYYGKVIVAEFGTNRILLEETKGAIVRDFCWIPGGRKVLFHCGGIGVLGLFGYRYLLDVDSGRAIRIEETLARLHDIHERK